MRVNIYYGGRGLIDDPTLYVLEKITKVLEELRVNVERYNLYEEKNNLAVLPKTLKGADGVILAASVEWIGIGGYLQQFLDSCWLYGDKELISHIYMMPVVMATTYGEREAEYTIVRSWEMLGGVPSPGLCAYIENHVDFETNAEYNLLIEKQAENFYRYISKKTVALPSSTMQVKKTVLRGSNVSLTPQESEQLSEYVSNDNYVKKQKEDIEELASLFKGLLGEEDTPDATEDEYVAKLRENFYPMDGLTAIFRMDFVGEDSAERSIIIDIEEKNLKCYRVSRTDDSVNADVTAKIKKNTLSQIFRGEKTFQSAFLEGDLSAQGNFKILRNFDTIFRF